ncbi:MAG: hypothetical protein ACRD0P_18965 [Stackebrandtia sp.]
MNRRRGVRRGLVVWLLLSAAGTGVVVVPDDGQRVVTLGEGHGPSPWDLVGVTMLVLGWVFLLVPLLRARPLIPAPAFVLGSVLMGLVVVAWSVTQGAGTWWVLGAAVAAGAQLFAALAVAREPRL